jgi:hypothetical protein
MPNNGFFLKSNDSVIIRKVNTYEVEKDGLLHKFRYVNNVPLNSSNRDIRVNFLDYGQIDPSGKKPKLFIFRNDKELLLAKLTPKGLSQKEIIGASTKELKSMKFKLKTYRDFPLKT